MITSLVLDPEVFSDDVLGDEVARREVERLLEGVLRNGILLDTAERTLVRQIAGAAGGLTIARRQRLELLLAEVLKGGTGLVARLDPDFLPKGRSRFALIRALARRLVADAVVTTEASVTALGDLRDVDAIEVSTPTDHAYGRAERRRLDYEQWDRSLDELETPERTDLLARMTRYAWRLTIADPQIGLAGPRLDRFRFGVREILETWARARAPMERSDRPRVEILTTAGRTARKGYVEPEDAAESIRAGLVEPLGEIEGDLRFRLVVKSDADGLFHARFLEANGRCFNFERGFDLFPVGKGATSTTDERTRPNLVAHHPGGTRYLRRIRALPTMLEREY